MSMQPMVRSLDHRELEGDKDPELFFSNNVYDSNTDRIGDLSEKEVTAVIDFYSAAAKVQGVGNKSDGRVFIEATERDVYSKLLKALSALKQNTSGFGPQVDELEEPLPVAEPGEPI